jgi:hypothetical protein
LVGHHRDIKHGRTGDNQGAGRINEPFVKFDLGILLCDFPGHLDKEPVGLLEHIGFMNRRYFAPGIRFGKLKSKAHNRF